jgi:arginyl-tRNA synthetase
MYKAKIEKELGTAVRELGFVAPTDIVLSISEKAQFGDYSSNIALQLSKQKHQNSYQTPQEIANGIIEKLGHPKFLERVEVAGPGFLNFFIKDEAIVKILTNTEDRDSLLDQEDLKKIIVEYCDPNTHKMLHIGHLLQLTLGEAMARLYEYQGHEVFRTNYGSDIGPTVAKCLWGIGKLQEEYKKAQGGSLREKAQFLGKTYAYAHSEYEKSLDVKEEIDQITNKLYQRDSEIMPLWEETKDWSLGYFETVYSSFGTLFDRRINESEVDEIGKDTVMENIGKVFVKDDGAIIFQGEKHNLHNRVFINSKGNPTYEGKEVGLAVKYQEFFQFDQLNIFSHKEQDDYFKVVIAVNEMIFPHLKGMINHVTYGEVRLPSGKMSSRQGNIIAAEDILEEVKAKIREATKVSKGSEVAKVGDELTIQNLAVSAIKLAFLKYSVGSDLIYDVEESVSIHGDTGPYVMYVYARILSVIKKATANRASEFEAGAEEDEDQEEGIAQGEETTASSQQLTDKKKKKSEDWKLSTVDLESEEREILRQLEYFEFMVEKATVNFAPNELVKYLLTLTKAFNTFYEKHHIVGSNKAEFRLLLSKKVSESIKLGLYLLGIETVDKM